MPRKALSQTDIESFRVSFCETAYALYEKEDYDSVTMRGVAKVLGCSPMTAYRYFENKEDVFAMLRAMRFHRLAQTLEDVSVSLSPLDYLKQLGKAYVSFAQNNPQVYRLLYVLPIDRLRVYPEVVQGQNRTQKVLFDATRRAVESGDIKGEPVLLAHTFWASIHGLVSLDLANQLTQGASFNELFPAMLNYLVQDE